MRLIDADALCEKLELLARHEDVFRQSVILGVVHTVKAEPTIEARPVVRGEWISLAHCANAEDDLNRFSLEHDLEKGFEHLGVW